MKSISLKCLLLVTALSVASTVGMKKSATVLEFFNNLFSAEKNTETNQLEEKYLAAPAKRQRAIANNSSATMNEASIQHEWLQISSIDFLNKNKYPSLEMPDGKEVNIHVDAHYFRINDSFEEGKKDANHPKNPLDFWFTITKNKIFYTALKDDYNLLEVIEYKRVEKEADSTRACLLIDDVKNSRFVVCASSENQRMKVFCNLKMNLKEDAYDCRTNSKNGQVDFTLLTKPTLLEEKKIEPVILVPLPSKQCNADWNYLNKGDDWECLCAESKSQSPIDLPPSFKSIDSPVRPVFRYHEVSAKSQLTTMDGEQKTNEYIKIKYSKNALRILHADLGKVVTLDGAVYVAEEIVFHTPSEHTIDGKQYDMEMQVIHYGQTTGDISKQVVLSFLFQKTPGVYNKFVDDVDFFSLPNSLIKERDIINNLFIPKVFYSSDSHDIPSMKPFSFYTYEGSLTAPPCSEKTIHYVASKPIKLGSAPIELLKESLRRPDAIGRPSGQGAEPDDATSNFRKTQARNGRPVFYFDHEKYWGKDLNFKKPDLKPIGHYEKLNRPVTDYFWVTGGEPSKIPGSFVVSEKEAKGNIEEQAGN